MERTISRDVLSISHFSVRGVAPDRPLLHLEPVPVYPRGSSLDLRGPVDREGLGSLSLEEEDRFSIFVEELVHGIES